LPELIPHLNDRRKNIVVDLTPILPGGENGGAKVMTLELIHQLGQLADDCEFVLLTSDKNHEELAALDSNNVRRFCVINRSGGENQVLSSFSVWKAKLRRRVAGLLPLPIKARLGFAIRRAHARFQGNSLLNGLQADLLFCPFTAPFFFDPSVPVVSVIYDLQHRYYPQFFEVDECFRREQHFKDACARARKLVCISNYVRDTVLQNVDSDSDHVVAVPIRLSRRLNSPSTGQVAAVLDRLGVGDGRFLFFPANFWLHKNHQMLFTAFGMYLSRFPESDLKLICTGAPDARMEYLREAVIRMGISDRILFPGYLTDQEFAALMQSCMAVIFPSLYEGFGMPVLEAMAFGKPVLCSNVTSLPEVAGDAALLFDPKKAISLIEAIERIENGPELASRLIEKGYERIANFGTPVDMAREYLHVFYEVMDGNGHVARALHGVYSDGWTAKHAYITFPKGTEQRQLEIILNVPTWLPFERVHAKVSQKNGASQIFAISRGETIAIQRLLPSEKGFIELLFEPVFQPKAYGFGEDTRQLGSICEACRIVSSEENFDLLEGKA
jgi:glycosyltransferase involved in cell wall biosynthesis